MRPNIDIHEWKIIESHWDSNHQIISESVFSLGNGRMGQRANNEEGFSGKHLLGSYIGGVYYPDKTKVGWWKNGYPEYFAKVLNSVNFSGLHLLIDGEVLDLNKVNVNSFKRELDMQQGILKREFQVIMKSGINVTVHAERFLSIAQDDLAVMRYQIEIDKNGIIDIEPFLDFNIKNSDSNWDETFWEPIKQGANEERAFIQNKTKKSDFHVCASMECRLEGVKGVPDEANNKVKTCYNISAKGHKKYILYKYVSVVSSQNIKKNIGNYAKKRAEYAANTGYQFLINEHKNKWLEKWKYADIKINGDPKAQQAIRFNIFQLLQTFTGVDPRLNIGPKGFTGEKYGGSTYWDTEAYCLPFYLASADPEISKNLLVYRYNQLDKAIENAEKLGFKNGAALFPMVTMNGEECHNEWEITFEEIHRNAAIVYAIYNYIRHTQDYNYLEEGGLEVIIAVARFWAQRVNWSDEQEKYVILGVTGPNEYENNVNNNYFTNFMASWCLKYGIDSIDTLKNKKSHSCKRIISKTNLKNKELENWKAIQENIFIPYSESYNIFLQQDGFLDKDITPAAEIPNDQRPINQNWSWDRILRSPYIKQADTLQGMFFFEDQTPMNVLKKNFDFYEPLTVHESSLSPSIHSILASRLDYKEKAYQLYLRTARLDLDDYNNEVHEGLHITAMGGTWMAIVYGFGGMKINGEMLCFEPKLPDQWEKLSFHIRWRKSILKIIIDANGFSIENIQGNKINFNVYGKDHTLEVDQIFDSRV